MPSDANQNPEQIARDQIDSRLRTSGWHVQDNTAIDFNAGPGIAVREYQTDVGPADYVLFGNEHPVGVVEAKPGKLVPQDPSDEPAQALLARSRANREKNADTKPRKLKRRRRPTSPI